MSNLKDIAVKYLRTLEVYEPYVVGFEKLGDVCWFEAQGAGYWAYQNDELMKKIKEIEKKYDILVYAITHEYTEFGEMYSMLYVSEEDESGYYEPHKTAENEYIVDAYVWNVDNSEFSEFGSIAVHSQFGGLKRVG